MSPNQETYTFDLRNVSFSNGDPFNAYQLWGQFYGLYYLSANSSSWWNGYQVLNMSASSFGPTTLSMMSKSGLIDPNADLLAIMQNSSWPIYVNGPHQIVFQITFPFQWFIGTFIDNVGLAFDTQWVLDHGGFGTPAQMNTYFNSNPPPGTGPYIVSKVIENELVTFTKNPNYWGAVLTPAQVMSNPYIDPGHVQTVVITVQTNDVARYVEYSHWSSFNCGDRVDGLVPCYVEP